MGLEISYGFNEEQDDEKDDASTESKDGEE